MMKCPKCKSSNIQQLGVKPDGHGDLVCLDCDWDNMDVLATSKDTDYVKFDNGSTLTLAGAGEPYQGVTSFDTVTNAYYAIGNGNCYILCPCGQDFAFGVGYHFNEMCMCGRIWDIYSNDNSVCVGYYESDVYHEVLREDMVGWRVHLSEARMNAGNSPQYIIGVDVATENSNAAVMRVRYTGNREVGHGDAVFSDEVEYIDDGFRCNPYYAESNGTFYALCACGFYIGMLTGRVLCPCGRRWESVGDGTRLAIVSFVYNGDRVIVPKLTYRDILDAAVSARRECEAQQGVNNWRNHIRRRDLNEW